MKEQRDDESKRPAGSMPPPAGIPLALFDYLQGAFGTLSGQMAETVANSRQALQIGQENRQEIATMKWHVFGPSGPPPMPSLVPPLVSGPPPPAPASTVIGRVATAEYDVDAAKARELVLAAKVATIENHIKAQSSAMGVTAPEVTASGEQETKPTAGEAFAVFLHSRAGQSFLLKIATLVITLATLAAGILSAHQATRAAQAPAVQAPIAVPR